MWLVDLGANQTLLGEGTDPFGELGNHGNRIDAALAGL